MRTGPSQSGGAFAPQLLQEKPTGVPTEKEEQRTPSYTRAASPERVPIDLGVKAAFRAALFQPTRLTTAC